MDALQQLLMQRARSDIQCLSDMSEESRHYCKAVDPLDPDYPKRIDSITREEITRVQRYSLMMVGETLVQLKPTSAKLWEARPELVAFRRLRDLYGHPSRHSYNAAAKQRFNEDEEAAFSRLGGRDLKSCAPLFEYAANNRPFHRKDFLRAMKHIQLYQWLDELAQSSTADPIPLDNEHTHTLFHRYAFGGASLDGLREYMHDTALPNYQIVKITDCAQRTSLFARNGEARLIDPHTVARLGIMRNHIAHDKSGWRGDDEPDMEDLLGEDGIQALWLITASLQPYSQCIIPAPEAVAQSYARQLLGENINDREARQVMCHAIGVIHKQKDAETKYNPRGAGPRFAEAFLLATGKMLRANGPQMTHQLLDKIAALHQPIQGDAYQYGRRGNADLDKFVAAFTEEVPSSRRVRHY